MKEYIDKKLLLDDIEAAEKEKGMGKVVAQTLNRYVKRVPAADVVELVHGRWEPGNPLCPICGKNKFDGLDADIWADWAPSFCPNCGAKMDGKQED